MNEVLENNRQKQVLVAEKIMGWKVEPDPGYHGLGGAMVAIEDDGTRHFLWHLCETVYSGEESWEPMKDIAAAWEVVEAMMRAGYYMEMSTWLDEYHVWFKGNSRYGFFLANTVTEAICLAALKAMED